jgi:DNA-binding MarR family transcriptional regulator
MSNRPLPGLALLLKQTEHRVQEELQPALDQLELSAGHWRIMSVLAAEPGMQMAPLADAAVLPPASLTRHVDHLVERGIIIRRIDAADKRRVVVALSPLGEVVASRLRGDEQLIEQAIEDELGTDRFRSLVAELTACRAPAEDRPRKKARL